MPSLRLLLAAALLAAGGAAVPVSAAPAPSVTGLAGSYLRVTITEPTHFDHSARDVYSLSSDRPDFVGVALVDLTGTSWYTLTYGLHQGTACSIAARCDFWDVPNVDGSTWGANGGMDLKPGVYRLALLGRPGATVKLTAPWKFLKGAQRATQRGTLEVKDLASTYPRTDTTQPEADGEGRFETRGPAVVGLLTRIDTELAKQATYDICMGPSEVKIPYQVACEGSPVYHAGGIYYLECPPEGDPVFLCLPFGVTPSSVSLGASGVLTGGKVRAAYNMEVRAVKSRVSALAFALSF